MSFAYSVIPDTHQHGYLLWGNMMVRLYRVQYMHIIIHENSNKEKATQSYIASYYLFVLIESLPNSW